MTTQAEFLDKIKSTIPRWFGDNTPNLDGLLSGFVANFAYISDLYNYAKLQTRIKTATDSWLDMISVDFFGKRLPRKFQQSDASYRARIIANLFRERATRNSIKLVLEDLTGRTPVIFEPYRPQDTKGWDCSAFGWDCDVGVAGWGEELDYQTFVIAYRPTGQGIANVIGFDCTAGAWDTASQIKWCEMDMIEGFVTDADIYEAIDSVKPVGTIIWTQIKS